MNSGHLLRDNTMITTVREDIPILICGTETQSLSEEKTIRWLCEKCFMDRKASCLSMS